MARLNETKVKAADRNILPIILEKGFSKKGLKESEKSKIEVFEKGLASQLSRSDTIEGSIEKIVKMALASEFGPSLVMNPGAKKMVATISRGILSDSELRRSALIIADRFAGSAPKNEVKLRGKRKNVING